MSNNNTLKTFTLTPNTQVKTLGWYWCSKDSLTAICVTGVNSLQWKGLEANTCLAIVMTELGNNLSEHSQVDPHYELCEAGHESCISGDNVIAKAGTQVQVNSQEIPKVKAIFINLGNKLKKSSAQIVTFANNSVTNPGRRLVLLSNISKGFNK